MLTVSTHLIKKFAVFCCHRSSITVFKKPSTKSWARRIQSRTPQNIYLTSTLILPFHVRLGLSEWSLPFRFTDQNFLCISHFSHASYISRPSYPLWFDYPTNICEVYKFLISALCRLLHPPVTSFLLHPNVLLSTLFSHTSNLCYSLNVQPKTYFKKFSYFLAFWHPEITEYLNNGRTNTSCSQICVCCVCSAIPLQTRCSEAYKYADFSYILRLSLSLVPELRTVPTVFIISFATPSGGLFPWSA
jgi:hypothetical protein